VPTIQDSSSITIALIETDPRMTAESPDKPIESILRGATVPSPPQIIADLQFEMAMPDPDINAMTQLIANDVGLAGGVLKTVNSPFYGGGGEIISVSQAASILGMEAVMEIINTLCLRNARLQIEDIDDALFASMTRFWDSATDVARACTLVAQKMLFPNPDQAYALGLFHNAGIPLLMLKYDNYAEVIRESYATPAPRIVDVENRRLDTNHAVMSFFVARSWKLPSHLCKLISSHHNIDTFQARDIADTEHNQLLAILKLAEHLAKLHRVIGDQHKDREWEQIGDRVLEVAGVTTYDLEDMQMQAEDLGLGDQQYFL